MSDPSRPPGQPGIEPRWTSSAKTGVGTAVNCQSHVWFTISHGIVNEVYYPNVDQANVRDLGFLVAGPDGYFSEEKRDAEHDVAPLEQGVPGYRIVNTCLQGRYRIEKTIVADPERNVLLQQVRFEPLQGRLEDYGLFALLAPHLHNGGYGNSGWAGDYKGHPMLFARRGATALAMACSTPFQRMSCGYVGVSDGWQDVSGHGRMAWAYPAAPDGNIALTGAIDLLPCGGAFTLVLAFGRDADEAGLRARAGLLLPPAAVIARFVTEWREFQQQCAELPAPRQAGFDVYRVSTAVLKTHASKRFAGGLCASLSIPWGFSRGDDDLGGYHLVWPRDLVESAGGLLAAGAQAAARDSLFFLMATQETDGHWPQNMWISGAPHWRGVQMDETAFPILLADALRRQAALAGLDPWPTVRRAATFLLRNGPVSQQDRWEEDAGYSPFTLAVEIAALLAAADFADLAGEGEAARVIRETADAWNESIESWTYVTGTEVARRVGVDGYYVRIAPPDLPEAASALAGYVPIKNRPPGESNYPAVQIVSPDALALVRFGLRAARDPRIVNTVKVIDAVLKTATATGPVWHRYNGDGYGEHDDGQPFDGTGVGRGWPLLAGERGHYELAAGRKKTARELLAVMAAQSNAGLIPEQVWDAPDFAGGDLRSGRPAGSAMPLVWAHAEFIKLARSLRDGKVFDLPPQPVERYQVRATAAAHHLWCFNQKPRRLATGKTLRLMTLMPATVRWSADGWRTVAETPTRDTTLGIHVADLPTSALPAGGEVRFTFFWPGERRWEGRDFSVGVGLPAASAPSVRQKGG
jgi:glucoamylase